MTVHTLSRSAEYDVCVHMYYDTLSVDRNNMHMLTYMCLCKSFNNVRVQIYALYFDTLKVGGVNVRVCLCVYVCE